MYVFQNWSATSLKHGLFVRDFLQEQKWLILTREQEHFEWGFARIIAGSGQIENPDFVQGVPQNPSLRAAWPFVPNLFPKKGFTGSKHRYLEQINK